MTTKKYQPSLGLSCVGDSCTVSRRSIIKGSAVVAGGLMVGDSFGARAFAQTPVGSDAMIPRLNGGSMGGGTNPQANFSPFAPAKIAGTEGLLHEKLFEINDYNCEFVERLATDFEWSDETTLVLTLREGVTWNDGTPFTSDDVVFTLELVKANPALDLGGVMPFIDTITGEGSTVTITFNEPAVPTLNPIVETHIVPKHIWEGVDDPLTFTNAENPVGTGPYTLGSFNSEQVIWNRRDDYWAADEIKVEELGYTKPAEGQANMLRLVNGEYDFDAMYIPQVDQVYVQPDPENNHYWYDQGSSISFYMNLTMAPFDDVNFRKAVAYAINRDDIAQKAQLGYVTTASQTGLKLPGQAAWLNPDIENEGNIPYDVEQARTILTDAGYSLDGDTLKTPDGNNVEFTFKVPAGWNDWIQAANIVKDNLAQVGMTMNVETPDATIFDQDRASGNFETCFGVHGGGCSMYRNFYDPLASAATKPIGEAATSNFVRWQDEETDSILADLFASQTEDEQKTLVGQLQSIMVEQFPVVPLWYGAKWFQYRTENAVGWPSEEDPYASSTDFPIILRHLRAPEGAE